MKKYITLQELYYPKDKQSRDIFRWHEHSSHTVDDTERATSFSGGLTSNTVAADRFGNDTSLYRGSTKVYDRAKNRHGNTDAEAQRDADLGRASPVNTQGKPGLMQTSIPTPTYNMKNLKGVDDS